MNFFDGQVAAWSNPPVDDVGYIPSETMLGWPADHLKQVIEQMRFVRYSEQAWRNWEGGWRRGLRLDDMLGLVVLDYGCGTGMEALEIALQGNDVVLADISEPNLELATRVMNLYGMQPLNTLLVQEGPPFIPPVQVDVVHCSGVLHHIPYPKLVVDRFAELLQPGGEVHLMLYSDQGWRTYIGTEPPADVTQDPMFQHFIRTFDQVGQYADWYDEAKVRALAGDNFDLVEYSYITVDNRYCTAVLVKR